MTDGQTNIFYFTITVSYAITLDAVIKVYLILIPQTIPPPSIHGISPPEDYAPIVACAKRFGVPLFTFLLPTYPYRWRCKLFHGNRTTALLTAYNDYELAVLHTVNYFLDRFLNEEIPKIFDEGYWTTEKQDAIDTYWRAVAQKDFEKASKKRQQHLAATDKERRGVF